MLSYKSAVLTSAVKIAGQPIANIIASTTGTDADWVVKVIDVYPDEVGNSPKMGGYQLAVSMDIFRGRYRESFETPKAIAPNTPLALQVRAAGGEPRLSARPPDHGADPVELVPALRSQSADVRAEHLLGQAERLSEGRASHFPRTVACELRRVAGGVWNAVTKSSKAFRSLHDDSGEDACRNQHDAERRSAGRS